MVKVFKNIWKKFIKSQYEYWFKTTNPKEEYYNNKYPKKIIYYYGRYIPNKGKYKVDLRNFFINSNSDELQNIVKSMKEKSDDKKAVFCQKWVKDNIRYVSDKIQFGIPEYWEYPQETLYTKKGDCDDGAILMANLMLASGIPYWKIRLNAGNVYDKKGKNLGGHCWVNYYYEKEDKWVTMDWCFYPNLVSLRERPNYKDEFIYGNGIVWFSWNQKYSFAKSTTDMYKLEHIC
ncbi:MAG: transglutaminase-like domain-containing protein [Candidatus Heimdallarchaeaceae archaeon]